MSTHFLLARRHALRACLAVMAATVVSGCGSSTETVVATDPGAISLTLGAASGAITASGTSTIAVTVGRSGSFAGAVDLTVEGLPSGVTAAASPASVAAGATTSTVTLTATSAAVAGPATITVRAKGTGVSDKTSTYALTVQAAASAGAITMSLAPTSLSVAAGASGTSTITIGRTGTFAGAVTLAVSGAPAGVTAALSSVSVAGTSATLTVSVAAGTAASSSTITVSASAAGVTSVSSTLALTTTAASGSSGAIAFRFCEAPFPTFFAVQDGSGAWTRVTATNNVYSFDISSATGGVAYSVPNGAALQTSVYYGTKAEITAKGVFGCQTAITKTVNGTTAGLGQLDNAYVNFGNKVTTVIPVASTSFTLNGVPDGLHDLVATRNALSLSGTNISSLLAKVIVRRGLNPATGSTLPVLDFGAAEAVAPSSATATLGNLGGDQSLITVLFSTANGTNAVLYADPGSAGASRPYFGVPAAQLIAGDLHYVQATALPQGYLLDPVLAATSRSSGIFLAGAITNQTLTFGPVLSIPVVTSAATAPYVRLRAVVARQPEYNQIFSFSFQQSGTTSRSVTIDATAAYVGSGALDMTIPDLSAASYDNNFGLKVGVSTMYVVTASGYSAGAGGVALGAAGTTAVTAAKAGTITP
jgi:hypothetical protein